MKQLFLLTTLILVFFSCKTKTAPFPDNGVQLILTDTTNNGRAQGELSSLEYYSKLESQIGLRDLRRGADSLEVRLWYSFSLSDSRELYILRFRDSIGYLTYYEVHPKGFDFENENRNRQWSPYDDPILDSVSSKTIVLGKKAYENIHLDSLWLLKTESELSLPDSIGFNDCSSFVIEVADRRRFRFLTYHCPGGIYEQTRVKAVMDFMEYYHRIIEFARRWGVVSYRYN